MEIALTVSLLLALLILGQVGGQVSQVGQEARAAQPPSTDPPAKGKERPMPPRTATAEVVVEARRLEPSDPDSSRRPDALVLDAGDLDAPDAASLQEVLRERPELLVFDQVGNGLGTDVDLRGFAGGDHAAVLLDGVRVNAPDDNRADLELLFLDELERVEVLPGAGSTLSGPGAGAGVIRAVSRQVPSATGARSWQRFGENRSWTLGARAHLMPGALRTTWAVEQMESDGFRDNSDHRVTRARVRGQADTGQGLLSATLHHAEVRAGTPQSLTRREWAEDPESAPFNATDRQEARSGLAVLRWDGTRGPWDLALHGAVRDRSDDSLTTGRATRAQRGFRFDATTRSLEGVGQATRRWGPAELVLALEASGGRVRARLEETDGDGQDGILVSEDEATREMLGLSGQVAWPVAERGALEFGLRADHVRLESEGLALDPASQELAPRSGARTYNMLSPRLAYTRELGEGDGAGSGSWSVALARAFLLPTPNQLFAFPGFESNPDLDPTEILEVETSVSWSWPAGASLAVTGFAARARDEVFFDADAPGGPFGRNAGRDTRRLGIEARGTLALPSGWDLDLAWSWIEAEFREAWRALSGDRVRPGDRVPLVPRHQAALVLAGPLGRGWRLRLHGRYVGGRPLDNDPAGTAVPLDAHQVWDLGARWVPPRLGEAEVRLTLRNLLDESYATRGIAHTADEFGRITEFYTPAPGRHFQAGLRWSF